MYITFILEEEKWETINYRDIESNLYSVSNHGKTGKIYTKALCPDGYLRIRLKVKNLVKKKTYTVHRIVAWHFVEGYSDKKCVVNHLNNQRYICHKWNLEWTTQSENILHGFKHGNIKKKRGFCVNFKYTEPVIRQVCEYIEKDLSPKKIIKLMNIENKDKKSFGDLIHRLKAKCDWADITSEYNFSNKKFKREFSDELIHTICQYLEKGLYPRDIIKELGVVEKEKGSYAKLIGDIRHFKTRRNISKKYNFSTERLDKKIYSDDLIHLICQYLEKGYKTTDIIKIINIPIKEKIHYQNLIYDLKRRNVRTIITS